MPPHTFITRFRKEFSIFALVFFITFLTENERGIAPRKNFNNPPHAPFRNDSHRAERVLTTAVNDEIRVPSDMWRRPTEHPNWHPIPLPKCCFSPGARDVGTDSPTGDANIRYYGPGMEYTPHDLKKALGAVGGDLILIGDSIHRYWFDQLYCYLGGSRNFVKGVNTDKAEINEAFLRRHPEWMDDKNRDRFGVFNISPAEVTGNNAASNNLRAMNIRLIERSLMAFEYVLACLEYFNNHYPNDFSRGRPVFVINIGMHYNRWGGRGGGGDNGARFLRRDLKTLVLKCLKIGARCIFRENNPQYFRTEEGDGLYPRIKGDLKCFDTPRKVFGELSRWRNDVMREVLGELADLGDGKRGGSVSLMPIFEKLEGLSAKHLLAESDCTHYNCDSNIWEPFHISLTETLIGIISQQRTH